MANARAKVAAEGLKHPENLVGKHSENLVGQGRDFQYVSKTAAVRRHAGRATGQQLVARHALAAPPLKCGHQEVPTGTHPPAPAILG
jgi:hypothetical protein